MRKLLLGLIGLLFAIPAVADLDPCRNLFDKNQTYLNAYVNSNTGILTQGANQYSFVVPVKPNTKYTLTGSGSAWGSFTSNAIGITATHLVQSTDGSSNGTITTGPNDRYLIGMAYATGTQYNYRNTLQIEEGSTATEYVPFCATNIKIATTAYNSARFSPVVTELNDTIATIRSVVTNTINQTKAIADLQATKQTRPDENCPAGKKCLLVEDNDGTPHWYEIIESANRLPDGFTELQYIESTGTQWIDTGLKGNLNTKIEMDFALMRSSNTNIGIYGSAGATAQNQTAFCMVTNSTGTYVFPQFDSVSRTTTEAGNLNFVLGQRYHIVQSKDGWYYDNQLGATWANPESFTTPSNLKLFATDGCGTSGASAANSYARIYYTKIWDGNTLVRDFVPAKNSSGVIGMYDLADTNPATAFHTNAGSGTFVDGPEI